MADLQEIVDDLEAEIGRPISVEDRRWRLLAVPARIVRHARGLTLRLPPGDQLLAEVLARLRALPHPP